MFRNLASIFFGFTNKSQITDSILVKYHKRINKQFDLVSCMFAIHYMFDNIDSLRNVIHNIDMILKSGGYFFGVCLDGYLVNQKFKSSKKDVIEAKVGNRLLWSIKKKYNKFNDFNQDKPLDNIGQKISVYIETINQELDEYLVDYELLKYELAKRNIFPVESNELKDINLESVGSSTGSFEEIYKLYNKKNSIKLDKNNQEYSFLNRWFIFKKK
jgi:SAM-dependent methyltransferase